MPLRITSVEVANVMLREHRYMTISEIMCALAETYPHLTADHTAVTNVVRTFFKSPFAACLCKPGAYPRQYMLTSVKGYKFKIRGGRQVCFDDLPFNNGTREEKEKEYEKSQALSRMAFEIMNEAVRRRITVSVSGCEA
ncbi:hypothetical protein [Atlantibacter hermannii]|uniref:hypothetical protein n=1 Tax=Atlantibacter hermannii TaxID=565 RepID=UPI0028992F62|nr:hypothetical protein [Atlantibacter hermannii]